MRKFLATVTACTILSACGGGSGSSPAIPPAGNPITQSKANAVATITIPSKLTGSSARKRNPLWISPSTLGIDFAAAVNGNQVAYTFAALTPASPNCVTGSGGLTCTVPFAVVPGNQQMTVTLYDASQPFVGSPLAISSQFITGIGGITNNYSFNLNGVPAVVYTSSAISSYQSGVGGSFSVPITGEDTDGNTIPGQYDQIINAQAEDTTHTILVAPGQLSSGGAGTLNVNIGANPAAATTTLNYCSPLYQPFCGSNFHGPITITMTLPTNSIYVSNNGGGNVLAFLAGSNGNVPPVRTIPANTLAPGSTTPIGGGGAPSGIAIDGAAQVRFTEPTTNAIAFTARGVSNTSPVTLSQNFLAVFGSATTLNQPSGLAIDGSGQSWVANSASNSLVQLTCCGGNRTPTKTISGALTTLNNPSGIAYESAGSNVYVVNNGGSVLKFPAAAAGNAAPSATVTSAAFNGAAGVTVVAGKIYVTNTGNNSIAIFPNTANGLSVPTTVIQGAATGLSGPTGIAVDSLGNIYVANNIANTITVYASGATGNAAPVRTITGAATGLNHPVGIVLTP